VERPSPGEPVTDDNWREALGNRVTDWTLYLTRQITEQPWRDVLATWWPRLGERRAIKTLLQP
jgi:hypothetical protein